MSRFDIQNVTVYALELVCIVAKLAADSSVQWFWKLFNKNAFARRTQLMRLNFVIKCKKQVWIVEWVAALWKWNAPKRVLDLHLLLLLMTARTRSIRKLILCPDLCLSHSRTAIHCQYIWGYTVCDSSHFRFFPLCQIKEKIILIAVV